MIEEQISKRYEVYKFYVFFLFKTVSSTKMKTVLKELFTEIESDYS